MQKQNKTKLNILYKKSFFVFVFEKAKNFHF